MHHAATTHVNLLTLASSKGKAFSVHHSPPSTRTAPSSRSVRAASPNLANPTDKSDVTVMRVRRHSSLLVQVGTFAQSSPCRRKRIPKDGRDCSPCVSSCNACGPCNLLAFGLSLCPFNGAFSCTCNHGFLDAPLETHLDPVWQQFPGSQCGRMGARSTYL